MANPSDQKMIPDVATQIMERMVCMPPKQHKDMKLGKPRAKAEPKERPASKGRVRKGNRGPRCQLERAASFYGRNALRMNSAMLSGGWEGVRLQIRVDHADTKITISEGIKLSPRRHWRMVAIAEVGSSALA
jgi:hypothetical protein